MLTGSEGVRQEAIEGVRQEAVVGVRQEAVEGVRQEAVEGVRQEAVGVRQEAADPKPQANNRSQSRSCPRICWMLYIAIAETYVSSQCT